MVKIEIAINDKGEEQTSLYKNGLLVGWRNLERKEQVNLMRYLSENYFAAQRSLNEV